MNNNTHKMMRMQIILVMLLVLAIAILVLIILSPMLQDRYLQDNESIGETETETELDSSVICTSVYHETVSVKDIFDDFREYLDNHTDHNVNWFPLDVAVKYNLNEKIRRRLDSADEEEKFSPDEAPLYSYEEIIEAVVPYAKWTDMHERFPIEMAIPTSVFSITLVVYRTVDESGNEGYLYLYIQQFKSMEVLCYVPESQQPTEYYSSIKCGDWLETLLETYPAVHIGGNYQLRNGFFGMISSDGIILWHCKSRLDESSWVQDPEIWRIDELPFGTERMPLSIEESKELAGISYRLLFNALYSLESILLPEPAAP